VEEIINPAHLESNISQGKPSGAAPNKGQGNGDNAPNSAESPTADCFHNNASCYDDTDNSVLISGKLKC
jgi:hypothetical protein